MPETSLLQTVTSTWPKAHAAALDALAGIGPNEPVERRDALRQRATKAAERVFREASSPSPGRAVDGAAPMRDPIKRVRARITWGGARPMVDLEVVTMDGQIFEGGSALVRPSDKPTTSADAKAESKVEPVKTSGK